MAAISSSTVTAQLCKNPSRNFTALSSSSSVFFSYSISNQAGLGLAVDLPKRAKKRGLSCNCLFGLGVPEVVVIVGVAALVFGPKQLPEVGRSIGKTIKSFQQAAKEFESELKKDSESSAEPSSQKITTAIEEQKQEVKVPSAKESSKIRYTLMRCYVLLYSSSLSHLHPTRLYYGHNLEGFESCWIIFNSASITQFLN